MAGGEVSVFVGSTDKLCHLATSVETIRRADREFTAFGIPASSVTDAQSSAHKSRRMFRHA